MDIKFQIKYLKSHRFVRNVAFLQGGSFAGSVVQALVGVFLARLLQPEFFGVYALVFSLAGILSLFLGIGARDAIATVLGEAYAQKDREKIHEAMAFLLKFTLITGLIVLAGMFFSPLIAQVFYKNSAIGVYAGVVLLGVLVSSSFFSLSAIVLQVVDKVKIMTGMVFADQILRNGLALALVFFGFGVGGAVSGHLGGAIIIFFVSIVVWEKVRRQFTIFPSIRTLFSQLPRVSIKKYLSFSIWVALDQSIANLYGLLPVLLTGIFVSTTEVSFFKLAFAFVNLALGLLGPVSTLLNVEFPKMKVEELGKLRQNFIKVSLYSLGLSAALTAGAIIVAPIAFKFFYGESFIMSVKYVYGLFVYGALFGLGVGLGPMWRAINKVKVSIAINLAVLGVGVPFGLWLIKNYGLWGSVIMVTLWFTVSHFISFIYLARRLKRV